MQIKKITDFAQDAKGTDLNVWFDVLVSLGFNLKKERNGWHGILMDAIIAMLYKQQTPGNDIGKDFTEFENKTIMLYKNRNGYRAGGDVRISNATHDYKKDNNYNNSLFKQKSHKELFNLHYDDKLIDFRLCEVSNDILKKDYEYLIGNIDNGLVKSTPKSRKGDLAVVKYHPNNDSSVFAWPGNKIFDISESILVDNKNIPVIENQKDKISSLIKKYNMVYLHKSTKKEEVRININEILSKRIGDKELVKDLMKDLELII